MSDQISEWVDAALEAGPPRGANIEQCPNCKWRSFHGLPVPGCPGSHVKLINPDDIRDAVIDWSDDMFGRGDE